MEDEKMIRAILAGHVLGGMIANRWGHMPADTTKAQIAGEAVRWADNLLVELKKDSPTPAEESPPPGLTVPVGVGDVVPERKVEAAPAAGWGRVADHGAAWHLWRKDAGEAECGEATDAEIDWLPFNTGMDPEQVCLDCKDIADHPRVAETTASSGAPNPVAAGSIPARPAHPCEAIGCAAPSDRFFFCGPREDPWSEEAHFCSVHAAVRPPSILLEWHRVFLKKSRAA
jgi:hypothetical protein